MTFNLLTKLHLELLGLTGGCTGSSESTLVKMPHCWKSHVTAQLLCSVFCQKILDVMIVIDFVVCSLLNIVLC